MHYERRECSDDVAHGVAVVATFAAVADDAKNGAAVQRSSWPNQRPTLEFGGPTIGIQCATSGPHHTQGTIAIRDAAYGGFSSFIEQMPPRQ